MQGTDLYFVDKVVQTLVSHVQLSGSVLRETLHHVSDKELDLGATRAQQTGLSFCCLCVDILSTMVLGALSLSNCSSGVPPNL